MPVRVRKTRTGGGQMEIDVEKHVRPGKVEGYVFKCPNCKEDAVTGLSKEQVAHNGAVHLITCMKKGDGNHG